MTSQIPSLAIKMILPLETVIFLIVGSEVTPLVFILKSPKALVIAKVPCTLSFNISPPLDFILYYSSLSDAL